MKSQLIKLLVLHPLNSINYELLCTLKYSLHLEKNENSRRTLAWEGVSLQARLDGDVGLVVATAPALDGDTCGLSPHSRGLDDNTGHFNQLGHFVSLEERQGEESEIHNGSMTAYAYSCRIFSEVHIIVVLDTLMFPIMAYGRAKSAMV